MDAFVTNIEDATKENESFRRVLFTGQHAQLVVMSLRPGEELGLERHEDVDQFLRVEKGEGRLVVEGEERPFEEDDAAFIPAGTLHNVVNASAKKPLRLYTLYSPPHHPAGTLHETKADAVRAEAGETVTRAG